MTTIIESISTTIFVPTPLRGFTDNQSSVRVEGKTIGEALASLTDRYPDVRQHLYNEKGELRSFVNIYRNDEDIRYEDGIDTSLADGDSISIVPSIAGG